MTTFTITDKHSAIKQYYQSLDALRAQGATNEMTVREPFKALLQQVAPKEWTLLVEDRLKGMPHVVRPDGIFRDALTIERGYWEAKDTKDNLEAEIAKKFAKGYPKSNIIFEDTRRAVLYQAGQLAGEYDLTQPAEVATLLTRFMSYTEPVIEEFERAVERFRDDTPKLARGLLDKIEEAHKRNKAFQAAYADFMELCKKALNPNISREAVNEMLIQHLLTERLMRTVFDNPDFNRRNVIAAEVEKVIDALTSQAFNRREFLGQLNYFYEAIEATAKEQHSFSERQTFINTVYERFFQGFAVKVADTHGIVYTPQPIVDFMCAAVEEVLRDEFGYGFDNPEVCIIDPCTGTGNFILNLLRRIHKANPAALPAVYRERLFANEVMLLPYYVASLNIEHEYYALTGQYEAFEGMCFVDTLDLAEGPQMAFEFMTQANTERIERQKQAKITVIIGNPPYNVGQESENENNKNRPYEHLDSRIRETYAKDSAATLKMQLYDPYVRFFRWASDRLGNRDGIVCYVSNNGFVEGIAFDGFRKHMLQDFTAIYHLDLSGNARTSGERRRREGGNVFLDKIRVGVGITVAVRSSAHQAKRFFYYRVPDYWKADEKLGYLEEMVEVRGRHNSLNTVEWQTLTPDERNTWLVAENADEFEQFIPIGSKVSKRAKHTAKGTVFITYSGGVKTNRDAVVFDFDRTTLLERVEQFLDTYNTAVDRYRRTLVSGDSAKSRVYTDKFASQYHIKWDGTLKDHLERQRYIEFGSDNVRTALYRPYSKQFLYFDRLVINRVYLLPQFFPQLRTEQENKVICLSGVGSLKPFHSVMVSQVPCLDILEKTQCFPFYTYDEDGSNRRENITDWALDHFRTHYADPSISKWDIFYYVYGLLHHPAYRERYADSLKRDLPRIPFAPDFGAFATAGRALADLHLGYEAVEPYPLRYEWQAGQPVSYRVEKMRLTKDKTALKVNGVLTLAGIPAAAYDYRLGNRSALEWVIDQYQVKEDSRSGIVSDPNQYSADEEYIVKLVGRVVQVSVETVRLVAGLPDFR